MIKATTLMLLLGVSLASLNEEYARFLSGAEQLDADDMVQMWNSFNAEYKGNSVVNEEAFSVFAENVAEIIEFNKDSSNKYKKGINQFTDLTFEEWSKVYLNAPLDTACKAMHRENAEERL